ncbi:uncharacterized protein LOC131684925 [Topomyia yanbarensis]|uniref:uncharacterized protein LOC131684925 n=1 Tax=Topomyia yanbarensis TaxID=2498891 RepID=UPI00273C8225|nr:uncharacterized protein LOC131684925 [Topomyia yanbarensis]
MPKTVPKSSANDLVGSARSSTNGSTSGAKRRHSELEPNGGSDSSESPRKRPNRIEPDQRTERPQPINPVIDAAASANPSPPNSPGGGVGPDFLLQALRRIQELQDEIDFLENDPYAEDADSTEDDESSFEQDHHPAVGSVVLGHQAEALGFAVCARETMAFLEREGVSSDDPMLVNLRNRLIGRAEQNLSC